MFDYFQLDVMLCGRCGCGLTGVALIDIAQLNIASGLLLDLFGQPINLGKLLFIRYGHMQRKEMTQRINRRMHL